MSRKLLNIGVCGVGTVGLATIEILRDHSETLLARSGQAIVVSHVGSRREHPNHDYGEARVSRDVFDVARDPDVDVLVELIGGTTVAHDLIKLAIQQGKHVVTANKALIAEHGNELIAAAEAAGVQIRYEAAVAGGIPVIKVLRESLAANAVTEVAGIINGTGNFILTEMSTKGRAFDDVLSEAQALGYAEADPTFDIDGTDAAHKLVILASLAFGIPLSIDAPHEAGYSGGGSRGSGVRRCDGISRQTFGYRAPDGAGHRDARAPDAHSRAQANCHGRRRSQCRHDLR